MNLSAVTCFVFDFDGTLAPNLDLPDMRRQLIALTVAEGVPPSAFADRYIIEIIDAAHAWLQASGRGGADAYRDRAQQFIIDFELAAALDIAPFPEVRPLCEQLKRRGARSAVITRNCEQAVRNTFPDIDDHLDLLLARDNVEHFKPDPRHLDQALEALAQAPANAVMVGDGRMDMEVGRSSGLTCVGVLTGSSTRSELEAAGAHLVLDHVSQLQAYL